MKCPECGRSFESEHGMKTHYGQSHDGSISGLEVTCDVCGDTFRKQRSHVEQTQRDLCSDECKSESYKNRVTLTCDYCGDSYERRQSKVSDSENHFCSNECQGRHREEHQANDGTLTLTCEACGDTFERYRSNQERTTAMFCSWECRDESYRVEPVTLPCDACGVEIKRYPSRIERHDSFYCSVECRSDAHSAMNHPQWRGNTDLTNLFRRGLSPGWDATRSALREERDRTCKMCGAPEPSDTEWHHELHHIIPIMAGGTHHPDNLMFLCPACHRTAEAKTVGLIDYPLAAAVRRFAD